MPTEKPAANVTLLPSLAFLLFGVALALGFVVASDKVGKSIGQFKQARPEITVKGVATLDVRSGQASMSCTLSWRGENFAEGRAALVAQRKAIGQALRTAGFAETEVIFAASEFSRLEPAIFVEYAAAPDGGRAPIQRAPVDFSRYARGKVPEFVFTQSFAIETMNVDRLLAFSRQEVYLDDGVHLSRSSPVFRLVKLNESKQELLEAAAKDAQRRAATMVAGTGSKVGALLDASQGVIQISAKDRVGESDSGSIDLYSIDKTIRVVVTMRFEIVRE
jgi:hypothetical protein